jgi:hypothetical protein
MNFLRKKTTKNSTSKLKSFLFEDNNSKSTEDVKDYNIGGYHPVFIGEVLQNRYILQRKISKTQYASLWQALDLKYSINVCIKIYKSAPYFNEVGLEEISILRILYKKAKEQTWINKLSDLKEKFKLDKILKNENFCVKLNKKIFKLFFTRRPKRKSSLCRIRISRSYFKAINEE